MCEGVCVRAKCKIERIIHGLPLRTDVFWSCKNMTVSARFAILDVLKCFVPCESENGVLGHNSAL